MRVNIFIVIILFIFQFYIEDGVCMSSVKEINNETVYYGGFAGYSIPLKPEERIDKEEALSRKTYCIAYYDSEGKMLSFEKYLNSSLFFRHEYKYHDNGKIKECISINQDGERYMHLFNMKGKEITSKKISEKPEGKNGATH
jgi:hypothetical protein